MIPRNAHKYCCEDLSLIENYELAKNDPEPYKWCIHHRDECRELPSGMIVVRTMEELIENGRYYNCPANELIFLTTSEHWKLHHKMGSFGFGEEFGDKVSKATKEAMKKVDRNKLAVWKGTKQSEATKSKRKEKLEYRINAYHEYKAKGGKLKFNDFQHTFFTNNRRKHKDYYEINQETQSIISK